MDQNEFSAPESITPSSANGDFESASNASTASAASASSDFDSPSGSESSTEGPGFSDRVREIAGSAQHTLADVGSTVSEKASSAKSAIADTVESGVDRLKNIDFDSMKASVERQVRDHPGRTLLMAVGVGYLVGRAFKK